jgi:hypothetical protein
MQNRFYNFWYARISRNIIWSTLQCECWRLYSISWQWCLFFFEMELTLMFSLLKKRSTDMEPYVQMVSAKSVEFYQASNIKGCSNIFHWLPRWRWWSTGWSRYAPLWWRSLLFWYVCCWVHAEEEPHLDWITHHTGFQWATGCSLQIFGIF